MTVAARLVLLVLAVVVLGAAPPWSGPCDPRSGGVCAPPAPSLPRLQSEAAVPAALVAASCKVEARLGTTSQSGTGVAIACVPFDSVIGPQSPEDRSVLVLTCRHVIRQGALHVVSWPDGRRSNYAVVLATDDIADMAVLLCYVRGDVPAAQIAEDDARPGEPVWQVGYPGGQGPVRRAGTMLGPRGLAGRATVFGVALRVHQGDSGSGVFRQSDQRLVGVLWGSTGTEAAATGAADIRRFIQKHCHRYFQRPPAQRENTPSPPAVPPAVPPTPAPSQLESSVRQLDERVKRLEGALAEAKPDGAAVRQLDERVKRLEGAQRPSAPPPANNGGISGSISYLVIPRVRVSDR